MKPSVYIETTIVSCVTSRPNKDLIVAAHQKQTHEWWDTQGPQFNLHTSGVVVLEASAGDPPVAADRLAVLKRLPLLQSPPSAASLAVALVGGGPIPAKASRDALHVAIAAVNAMDYLLTWNCTHLANAYLRARIEEVCSRAGFRAPIICTPEELFVSEP